MAPHARWSGRTRGTLPPSNRWLVSVGTNPSDAARWRHPGTRCSAWPRCAREFPQGSGRPPRQLRSLHLPPAALILPRPRPIRVLLQTQKEPLAVSSFGLPRSIQPNFRNETICLRAANSAVSPLLLCALVCNCLYRRAEPLSSFRRIEWHLALTVISQFFSAISQRSLCAWSFLHFAQITATQ